MISEIKLYLSAIFLALFSKKFYYDLILGKKIYGFGYLLFLSFLISFPVSNALKSSLDKFIGLSSPASVEEANENILYIAEQIPEITIKDNKLESSSPSPIVVLSKTDKPIFIIDTEDSMKDYSDYQDVVIVNSNQFTLLFDGAPLSISLIDAIVDLTDYLVKKDGYTEFDLKSLFLDMRGLFLFPEVAFLLVATIWFFVRYAFKALAFSFFAGFLVNLVLKGSALTFRAFLRISSFALTIVFLLEFTSFYLGRNLFSSPELVYFVAHLLYIYYAIDAYKQMSVKD